MATAQQIINQSYRFLTGGPANTAAPANDSADLLVLLNSMLDSWRLERLMVYQIAQGAGVAWAAGVPSKTIGSGGTINVERPVRVESAMVRLLTNEDFGVRVEYDRSVYDEQVQKGLSASIPDFLFVDPAYPLSVLYLFPVPSENVTLFLSTWVILQNFANLATNVALPPGYEMALQTGLAEFALLAYPSAEREGLIRRAALGAKGRIKNLNYLPMTAAPIEITRSSSGSKYNIEDDS